MAGFFGRAAQSARAAAGATFGEGAAQATGRLNNAFVGLGSLGTRGARRRVSMGRAMDRMAGGNTDPRLARIASGRRDQLMESGRRRAIIGGAGIGAVGISSGINGTRARSSGGYA